MLLNRLLEKGKTYDDDDGECEDGGKRWEILAQNTVFLMTVLFTIMSPTLGKVMMQ